MRLARDMAFPSRLHFAFPFPIPPMGILSSARPRARHPRVACDDRGEANIGLAPVLSLGAGVRPSSAFVPSPRNEGSDAPRRRVVRITPDGPDDHSGRTRIAGSWRISGCAAPTRRATRHLPLSRSRPVGPSPRSLCRGEASRVPPGDVTCVASRSRVPHPAPPSRHLATMPLGGRDGYNLW